MNFYSTTLTFEDTEGGGPLGHPLIRTRNSPDLIRARVNKRLPDLDLVVGDIQVAHRLQSNNKIIVKFLKRRVRETVFERRFELFTRSGGGEARDGPAGGDGSPRIGRRQMTPLYMSESLVPRMQQLYQTLLAARKPENGAKVASVFSRRGHVFCKTVKGGSNIRITDKEQLRRLLGGVLPVLPVRQAAAGSGPLGAADLVEPPAGPAPGAGAAPPAGVAAGGEVSAGGADQLMEAAADGDRTSEQRDPVDGDDCPLTLPVQSGVDSGSSTGRNKGKKQPAADGPPRRSDLAPSTRGGRQPAAAGGSGLSGSGRLAAGPWR